MGSIVVDRLNGRATEWVARNEVVLRLAAKHGIAVPLNEVCLQFDTGWGALECRGDAHQPRQPVDAFGVAGVAFLVQLVVG
ncbi:MAG: ketopantoate reductase C-terminal domain-containing protein [Micropepsaceae bacterium]